MSKPILFGKIIFEERRQVDKSFIPGKILQVGTKDAHKGRKSVGHYLEEPVDEMKCIECGKAIDTEWLKKHDIAVPLCPSCYEKVKHLFEEFDSQTTEVSSRCNSE